MEIIGYFSAIVIGISLGLIGGGGSILTVPVLVYLFSIDKILATSYSLFIVGITSFFGVLKYHKHGLINFKTAIIFGIPSIVSVFITRRYLLPSIPKEIVELGSFIITKELMIMVLFAIMMIAASFSMIKKPTYKKYNHPNEPQEFNYLLIAIEGLIVGMLTGMVGAGGGFLIIPALVVLSKLPMKQAIGTSLLIITVKSLIGFAGEIGHLQIDWIFLLIISGLSIIGLYIGVLFSKKVDGEKLKPAFGWFVLVMGIYILLNEFIL